MRRAQRDELASLVFSLSDSSVGFRNRARVVAGLVLWLTLSGFTILIYTLFVNERVHSYVIIILGLIKYIPMIIAAYILAKKMAARYLDDIYELNNNDLAYEFIEEVTFGKGREEITIAEGRIHENDEVSPIILIGGPGKIKINLGSAALLEKVDGEPHIITPRKDPWMLGRFERIREIGKDDRVGKREYAIVNLRDQFKDRLVVRSRTKDGIPIEVTGIKVIFHILRKDADNNVPKARGYKVNINAMQALAYKQSIISPEMKLSSSIGFPWDTTAIPLVITELENIITSHALGELLSNISQKEVDKAEENKEDLERMKFELTGQQTRVSEKVDMEVPNFFSRDRIKHLFFSKEFRKKAADLGIEVAWIDIGTWNILSDDIRKKLKDAEDLAEKNIAKRNAVESSRKKHEMTEIMQLFQNVIVENYEKASTRKSDIKDIENLKKLIKEKPELINDPKYTQLIVSLTNNPKNNPAEIATGLIKAIRKELLAGQILIARENRPDNEKRADIEKINRALSELKRHDI